MCDIYFWTSFRMWYGLSLPKMVQIQHFYIENGQNMYFIVSEVASLYLHKEILTYVHGIYFMMSFHM